MTESVQKVNITKLIKLRFNQFTILKLADHEKFQNPNDISNPVVWQHWIETLKKAFLKEVKSSRCLDKVQELAYFKIISKKQASSLKIISYLFLE